MDRVDHRVILQDNIHIVAFDGLDVAGKETLVKEVRRRLQALYPESIIEVISFPRYETLIGRQLYDMLHKPTKDRDPHRLQALFQQDRLEYFVALSNHKELYDYEPAKSNPIWILLDRCHFSNYLYGVLEELMEEELLEKLRNESRILPKMDFLCLLGRYTEESAQVHTSLIKKKPSKDENETLAIQEQLAERLSAMTISFLREAMDISHIVQLPIGSYFLEEGEGFLDWILDDLVDSIIKATIQK